MDFNKGKNAKVPVITLIGLWLTLILIVMLSVQLPGENLLLGIENVSDLNTGWIFSGSFTEQKQISLPASQDVRAAESFSISTKLPIAFADKQYVCIRTSMQTLTVRLEGQTVYAYNPVSPKAIQMPLASSWHLVGLPAGSQDKTLTLQFQSPYHAMSGLLNPVIYGSKGAILFYLVRTYGPGFVVAVLVLIIGLIMLAGSLLVRKIEDHSLLYLGFFSIFTALWLLSESKMLQFITGNQFFLASSAYLAIILVPIPMLLYIGEIITLQGQMVNRVFVVLFALLFCANLLLQLSGIAGFFELIWITHTLIVISALWVTGSLLNECVRLRNPEARKFIISIMVLIIFTLLEIMSFYARNFMTTSFFIRIGLFLFTAMLGLQSLKRVRKLIDQSKEARFFERMAYEDYLTGAQNRAAYNRDIQSLCSEPDKVKSFRLALLDVNDLKQINDQYGHSCGDQAIISTYHCLQKAFSHLGTCYRIGGDEFACIIRECDDFVINKAIADFYEQIHLIDQQTTYPFSVAIGEAIYDAEQNKPVQNFLAHVDQIMYMNKNRQKSGQPELYPLYPDHAVNQGTEKKRTDR